MRSELRVVPAFIVAGWIALQALTPGGFAQTMQQPGASWENLRQLRPGQRIQVVQKDLKSWSGTFVSVSDESVSLKSADGGKTVPRADVLRISRHGGKRLRNALIGAAAGGGAGAAIGAATGGCANNSFGICLGRKIPAAVYGVIGVVVGGAVGAAIPGTTKIYQAETVKR